MTNLKKKKVKNVIAVTLWSYKLGRFGACYLHETSKGYEVL